MSGRFLKSSVVTHDEATETTLKGLAKGFEDGTYPLDTTLTSIDGKLPATLGQKINDNSFAVTLSTEQEQLLVDLNNKIQEINITDSGKLIDSHFDRADLTGWTSDFDGTASITFQTDHYELKVQALDDYAKLYQQIELERDYPITIIFEAAMEGPGPRNASVLLLDTLPVGNTITGCGYGIGANGDEYKVATIIDDVYTWIAEPNLHGEFNTTYAGGTYVYWKMEIIPQDVEDHTIKFYDQDADGEWCIFHTIENSDVFNKSRSFYLVLNSSWVSSGGLDGVLRVKDIRLNQIKHEYGSGKIDPATQRVVIAEDQPILDTQVFDHGRIPLIYQNFERDTFPPTWRQSTSDDSFIDMNGSYLDMTISSAADQWSKVFSQPVKLRSDLTYTLEGAFKGEGTGTKKAFVGLVDTDFDASSNTPQGDAVGFLFAANGVGNPYLLMYQIDGVRNEILSVNTDNDFSNTWDGDMTTPEYWRMEITAGLIKWYDKYIDGSGADRWHLVHTQEIDLFLDESRTWYVSGDCWSDGGTVPSLSIWELSLYTHSNSYNIGKADAGCQRVVVAEDSKVPVHNGNLFGELNTTMLNPTFQYTFTHNLNNRVWTSVETGGEVTSGVVSAGSPAHNEFQILISNALGNNSSYYTAKPPVHYRNGQMAYYRCTARSSTYTAVPTSLQSFVFWGLGDRSSSTATLPNNCIVFGYNSTDGLFFGIKKSEADENTFTYFVKLTDRSEPVDFNYNPVNYYVWQIKFGYLGALGVDWDVYDVSQDRFITLHKYRNLDDPDSPYINNPILDACFGAWTEDVDTGNMALEAHSVACGVYGADFNPFPERALWINSGGIATDVGFFVVRVKTSYAGTANFARAHLEKLSVACNHSGGGKNISALHIYKGTTYLAAGPTYGDVDTNNSILETATVFSINVLGTLVHSVSIGDNGNVVEDLEDIYMEPGANLLFYAKSSATTTDYDVSLTFHEDF